MPLSPPKYPSAANVGAVVRLHKNGKHMPVPPSEEPSTVHDIIILGFSAGVSMQVHKFPDSHGVARIHTRGFPCVRFSCAAAPRREAPMCASATPPQWIVKKNRCKPYCNNDFTVQWLVAVTSASHPSKT